MTPLADEFEVQYCRFDEIARPFVCTDIRLMAGTLRWVDLAINILAETAREEVGQT